jgi:hypothetical protein
MDWEELLPELTDPIPQPGQLGAPVLVQISDNEEDHQPSPAYAASTIVSQAQLLKKMDETLDKTNKLIKENTQMLRMLKEQLQSGPVGRGLEPNRSGSQERLIISQERLMKDRRLTKLKSTGSCVDFTNYQFKEYDHQVYFIFLQDQN